ncbi:hypothetical protein HK405_013754 [Cladochytrium tenue]|nr:hypothetical protein HK405_013754 [Cladochytrium tenue]
MSSRRKQSVSNDGRRGQPPVRPASATIAHGDPPPAAARPPPPAGRTLFEPSPSSTSNYHAGTAQPPPRTAYARGPPRSSIAASVDAPPLPWGSSSSAASGVGSYARRRAAAGDPDYDRSLPIAVAPAPADPPSLPLHHKQNSHRRPLVAAARDRRRGPISASPVSPAAAAVDGSSDSDDDDDDEARGTSNGFGSPDDGDGDVGGDSADDGEDADELAGESRHERAFRDDAHGIAFSPRGSSGGASVRATRRSQQQARPGRGGGGFKSSAVMRAPAMQVVERLVSQGAPILERRDPAAVQQSQQQPRTIWEPTATSTTSPAVLGSSVGSSNRLMPLPVGIAKPPAGRAAQSAAASSVLGTSPMAASFGPVTSSLPGAGGGSGRRTLKLIDEHLRLHHDSAWRLLSDQVPAFVIGVVGRRAVGKSTICNLFADTTETFKVSSAVPQGMASSQASTAAILSASTLPTTLGIDMHCTRDGLVVLDSQGIVPSRRQSGPALEKAAPNLASLSSHLVSPSEQLAMFLLSVCHVILVVTDADNAHNAGGGGGSSSSGKDEELWAFLRRIEAVKYRADGGTGEIVPMVAGKRRARRRDRAKKSGDTSTSANAAAGGPGAASSDDDGRHDSDADAPAAADATELQAAAATGADAAPQSNGTRALSPSSDTGGTAGTREEHIRFPSLVFVVNRGGPDDFAPETHARVRDAIARAFRGSKMPVAGVARMGACFPRYQRLPTAAATAAAAAVVGGPATPEPSALAAVPPLEASGAGATDEPNLWILPLAADARPSSATAAGSMSRPTPGGSSVTRPLKSDARPSGMAAVAVAAAAAAAASSSGKPVAAARRPSADTLPQPSLPLSQQQQLQLTASKDAPPVSTDAGTTIPAYPSSIRWPAFPGLPTPDPPPAPLTERFPWLASTAALREHLDALRGAPARWLDLARLLRNAVLAGPRRPQQPPSTAASVTPPGHAEAAAAAAARRRSAVLQLVDHRALDPIDLAHLQSARAAAKRAVADAELAAANAAAAATADPPTATDGVEGVAAAPPRGAPTQQQQQRSTAPSDAVSERDWLRAAAVVWDSVHRGART